MKKIFLILFFILLIKISVAQQNCNNPMQVNICPGVVLLNQTNAGMGDDAGTCNVPGEDVVYQISIPSGAISVNIGIRNSTQSGCAFLKTGSCTGTCSSSCFNPGNTNITFATATATTYFLVIESSSTMTYDLLIGADSLTQYTSVPNTQGNCEWAGCAPNPFSPAKNFLEVQFNGVYMRNPMTLSPLLSPGTMCISLYLRNLSGVRGPKQFEFYFPVGFINVTPLTISFPGQYRAGTWNAAVSGNVITYSFADSAGLNYGDFNGPNSCAVYSFCFNMIPISNNPSLTNVTGFVYMDDNGRGYTGWQNFGCCPAGLNTCNLSGSNYSTSGGSAALGFGFDDPGNGGLPISLSAFTAKFEKDHVSINWRTESEINNEYFTVERSANGMEWEKVSEVAGSGTSSVIHEYSLQDYYFLKGENFYRLSQTDFDRTTRIYDPIHLNIKNEIPAVFPNPVTEELYFSAELSVEAIRLENLSGEIIQACEYFTEGNQQKIRLNKISPGIYFLRLILRDGTILNERIIKQ